MFGPQSGKFWILEWDDCALGIAAAATLVQDACPPIPWDIEYVMLL